MNLLFSDKEESIKRILWALLHNWAWLIRDLFLIVEEWRLGNPSKKVKCLSYYGTDVCCFHFLTCRCFVSSSFLLSLSLSLSR